MKTLLLCFFIGITATRVLGNETGSELFKANCASCHQPHKNSTGPKLFHVRQKWADGGARIGAIYMWVNNWQNATESDPYSRNVSAWAPTACVKFPELTKEEIDNLFDWIDSQEASSDSKLSNVNKYTLSLGWYIFFICFSIVCPLIIWIYRKRIMKETGFNVLIFALFGIFELASIYFIFSTKESVQIDLNWSRDNYDFDSISIDNTIWMTSNLSVDRFKNGEIIPQAKTPEEWKKAGEEMRPVWCYYQNDSLGNYSLGKLYNWYAVYNESGLAPDGWRVATKSDWEKLLKSEKTNNVFEVLRIENTNVRWWNGEFSTDENSSSFWWSSSEDWSTTAWALIIESQKKKIESVAKPNGFYVRCVRDN